MRGLLLKIGREVWPGTLLMGVALLLVEAALTWIVPQVEEDLMQQVWVSFPFVRDLLSALLGVDVGQGLTAQMLQSYVWVHPVVLALVWAHVIIACTRMPAGEIDRGTIDVLLGLPMSRRLLYAVESAMALASGAVVLAMGLAGYLLGSLAMSAEQRGAVPLVPVLVNLLAVYVAVGGVGFLVSALSDRRGRAVSMIFALVLASFLLNFLAQFWEPAEALVLSSVLDYYRPARIGAEGFPTGDVAVLVSVAAVGWAAGGEVMARRSICTV